MPIYSLYLVDPMQKDDNNRFKLGCNVLTDHQFEAMFPGVTVPYITSKTTPVPGVNGKIINHFSFRRDDIDMFRTLGIFEHLTAYDSMSTVAASFISEVYLGVTELLGLTAERVHNYDFIIERYRLVGTDDPHTFVEQYIKYLQEHYYTLLNALITNPWAHVYSK